MKESSSGRPSDQDKEADGGRAPTAVVIGAGFGGLSVAGRLAAAGYSVTVLEKREVPGGRCAEIVRDGHRFDVGPSIVLVPSAFEEAFAAVGVKLHDVCEFLKIDPTYTIHFHDGTKIQLTNDLQRMERQLESMEHGSFKQFLGLIRQGHDNLHMTLSAIAHRNFYSLFEFFSPANGWLLWRLNVLRKHYNYIKGVFTDPRLRSAFTFQDMYIGVSPYDAPATFSLLQYTEFCDGVWYCKGGMTRIGEALADAAVALGVKIVYQADVKELETSAGEVTGARLSDGSRHTADVFVANADLAYVYTHLLPDEGTPNQMRNKNYTSSAIMFYWGLNRVFPELGCHNMFLAKEFKKSFDEIFKDHALPQEPSFYIHAPARCDSAAAPQGHDTFMVLVPCGCIGTGQDRSGEVARARATVLERLKGLGVTELENHIKFEIVYTPEDWRELFNLEKGSCFGLSHTFTQLGYLRPHNQHAKYKNLFFAGCSTHPGSGLPNVLVSARLTAERILMMHAGYRTKSPLSSLEALVVLLTFLFQLFLGACQYPLSYIGFHFAFILPPLGFLGLRLSGRSRKGVAMRHMEKFSAGLRNLRSKCMMSAGVLSCLAMVWTTPWDNYLVYRGIWSYSSGRVAFSLGYVPIEEYCFFVLQTWGVCLWFLGVLERHSLQESVSALVSCKTERCLQGRRHCVEQEARYFGLLLLGGITVLGFCMLLFFSLRFVYMGLILSWGVPVLALQWYFGGHVTYRERKLVLAGIFLPTVYLWFADGLAIRMGTWSMNPTYLIGVYFGSLPIEEATFFLLTNSMVVQGALLFVRAAERMELLEKKGKRSTSLANDIFKAACML